MHLYRLKGVLITVSVVFFSCNFNTNDTEGFATVVVPSKIIDIGTSKRHSPAKGQFKIINTGEIALDIGKITTDCNCTVPSIDRRIISKGDSTAITLIYDGHDLGYFQKKAYVNCNIKEKVVLLVLRGNIIE